MKTVFAYALTTLLERVERCVSSLLVCYLRGRRVRACRAVVPTGREPVAQRDDIAWTTTAECLKAPVFLAISKVHGERTEILSSSLCCYKKHLDCQI